MVLDVLWPSGSVGCHWQQNQVAGLLCDGPILVPSLAKLGAVEVGTAIFTLAPWLICAISLLRFPCGL